MTATQKLEKIKSEIAELERQKIQAETRLESVGKQKEALYAECEAIGISPDDLDTKIHSIEAELEEGIRHLEALLGRPFSTPPAALGSSSNLDEMPY